MSQSFDTSKRARAVALTALAVVLFVGFFVGIRQSQPSVTEEFSDDALPDTAAHEGLPARTNAELSVHPWSNELPPWQLPSAEPPPPVTPRDDEARASALADRARLRAYEGAPPVIPHPIGEGNAQECATCHETGGRIGDVLIPPMSHEFQPMCTQCHAPTSRLPEAIDQRYENPSAAATVGSSFEGLRGSSSPYRWTDDSPPQMPHSSRMRERCTSCHGVNGRPGLQTSHPERQLCLQCHTSPARTNQWEPR